MRAILRQHIIYPLVLLGCVFGLANPAQAGGFDLGLLKPQPGGSPLHATATAATLQPMASRVDLLIDTAFNPLTVTLAGDEGVNVGRDTLLHNGLRVGVNADAEVRIVWPMRLTASGKNPTRPANDNTLSGFTSGDLRLGGIYRALALPWGTLFISPTLSLPTGDPEALMGDGETSFGLTAGAEGDVPESPFRWVANLGWWEHRDQRIASLSLGRQIRISGGIHGQVLEYGGIPLSAGGELLMAFETSDFLDAEDTPMELLGGVAAELGRCAVNLGLGFGLVGGVGAPVSRLVMGVSCAVDETRDYDHDGVTNPDDACFDVAEDRDGFEDANGCPDPDNDSDGLPDTKDRCPDDAEDKDGFEDGDGCPDPDNDGDGIHDTKDRCPDKAEDRDGFEDGDGCRDPDNDGDGIQDTKDRCPDKAEDKDGFEDEDGCPEPDNDRDGVNDDKDQCRTAREDRDGFEDEDGCPDPDNDGDGIEDGKDGCPNKAEDVDGFEDEDGCPEDDPPPKRKRRRRRRRR